MPFGKFHYRWEFDLKSSPEQIWPLVADTNRFNRDTGVPAVEALEAATSGAKSRRLRLSSFGIPIEWEEQPFEWIRPKRFGVVRRYSRGPISELRVLVELIPQTPAPSAAPPHQGTKLIYEVWATAKNLLGRIAIPVQIGWLSAGNFARTIREYDDLAQKGYAAANKSKAIEFAPGGRERLLALGERVAQSGGDADVVGALIDHLETADDFALARIRPYELARVWQNERRAVLETCLSATRAGLLDLQWNLICPMCRGGAAKDSLDQISSQVHCPACQVDYSVNFEQSVELTFRPNAAIRDIDVELYCVGGPQVTPHIVAQQLVEAGKSRTVEMPLEPGRYRIRSSAVPGWQHLIVAGDGSSTIAVRTGKGWTDDELSIAPNVTLTFDNETGSEQLLVVERTAWSDEAATAAEVTALQMFRDLFATEALRPGEQISVGTLTVLFTDLKNSTRLYREIGDATAFGRVMNHFDVLRKAIAAEDGAMVKTIGDAVMAVFRQPVNALRAMLHAQEVLANPANGQSLSLKAGVHTGPCIAVTLNERLDYFGSTVNLAARLEGQSTGDDVVISTSVYSDPAVREFLSGAGNGLALARFEIPLKGFDEERFELWRIGRISRTQAAPVSSMRLNAASGDAG